MGDDNDKANILEFKRPQRAFTITEPSADPRDVFVSRFWGELALLAYVGFTEEGRGALLVCPDSPDEYITVATLQIPVDFFSAEIICKNMPALKPEFGPDSMADLFEAYDPETQFICIFSLPNEQPTATNYSTGQWNLTPREAYDRSKQYERSESRS